MDYAIGVDLGGTQLRAALVDRRGHMLRHVRVPTEAHQGPYAVIDRIVDCVAQVRAALPPDARLLGIGVGSPGPLDPYTGVVLRAPNLPGWENIPLRDIVAEHTGLPAELGNDANLAALGEWHFGGGVGRQNLVYVTVSTGIGAGVIVDGRLLMGHKGAGGELGHMLLNVEGRQSWEDLASGTALGRAAATTMARHPTSLLHKLATPETVNASHVAEAALHDDPFAKALMQREGELLGLGFVTVLHLFGPELILVGGSVVMHNPWLLDEARRVVQAEVLADVYREVPIRLAALGDHVGVLGAAALILYQHKDQE